MELVNRLYPFFSEMIEKIDRMNANKIFSFAIITSLMDIGITWWIYEVNSALFFQYEMNQFFKHLVKNYGFLNSAITFALTDIIFSCLTYSRFVAFKGLVLSRGFVHFISLNWVPLSFNISLLNYIVIINWLILLPTKTFASLIVLLDPKFLPFLIDKGERILIFIKTLFHEKRKIHGRIL
jgi:hypothetical protein